jgi:hypothetical protein
MHFSSAEPRRHRVDSADRKGNSFLGVMQQPGSPRSKAALLSRAARPFGLVFLGAVVAYGCGTAPGVPTALHAQALGAVNGATAIAGHDRAIQERIALIVRDLGLPVPPDFSVFVYPSRERFREGLVRDAHISPARAAELAEFAIGVGKRRVLLFNDEGTSGRGREWVRLVAHELTHLAQFELAEGEGRGEQWLAEGLAEWTAFQVLEQLGLDEVARRRRIARAGVRARDLDDLELETLGTPRGFTRRHQRDGALPIYQLSYLMADYLIVRHGVERVADYFRSFQHSGERYQNFERAFGQPLDAFEAEVLADLRSAAP